jgi:hypothetical protein
MAYYRVYFLDVRGHITDAADGDLSSDGQAYALAESLIGSRPDAEIWQEKRLVGRLSRRYSLPMPMPVEGLSSLTECVSGVSLRPPAGFAV